MEAVSGSLTTSFGQRLDKSDTASSFSLEPRLETLLTENLSLKLYSLIDRPVETYEDFSVPTIDLYAEYNIPIHSSFSASAFLQSTAVDVTGWSLHGWAIRTAAGGGFSWQALSFLRLEASLGPFSQLNQYTQQASGETFPTWGMAQELKVVAHQRKWAIELAVFFLQSKKSRWRNEYLSAQQITYTPWDFLVVGVSHQLSDQLVSHSTGLARPFGLFDSRLSRLSGFLKWRL